MMLAMHSDAVTLGRFEKKYVPEPNTGCWLWIAGRTTFGYGRFSLRPGEQVYAHRFSYQVHIGQIPDGLQLDHVKARGCSGPECVNPSHLEPVTAQVNTLRGDSICAVNARKTHCTKGHEFTPENTLSQPGGRLCRECTRQAAERCNRKRGRVARISPTHCHGGHEYTMANRAPSSGGRGYKCRECWNKRMRDYRENHHG